MANGSRFQSPRIRLCSHFLGVCLPEQLCATHKRIAPGIQMVRFAENMREKKTYVERRIAEVNYFVVQQNQLFIVNQNIFRAEISVHDRDRSGVHSVYQRLKERSRFGYD